MARTTPRPTPTTTHTLQPLGRHCPLCGETMWAAYHNYRTITTLETWCISPCKSGAVSTGLSAVAPTLPPRSRRAPGLTQARVWPRCHRVRRYAALCAAPQCARNPSALGPPWGGHRPTDGHASARRYDELLALSLTDTARLQRLTQAQGRVILALDGLQPDVGHEVLWVLRDCLSGEVLLARSLLSATQEDLAALLARSSRLCSVPIVGVISDGQLSIRAAVAQVLYPRCRTNCVTFIT